ncbi:hypothetical protein JCM16358_22790 [Halanaerocella petrolearia]
MNESIKIKFAEFRKDADLTQKQMAEKLGISESYYCLLENGKRPMKLKMALEIAKILDKTPDEIFLPTNFTECKVENVG